MVNCLSSEYALIVEADDTLGECIVGIRLGTVSSLEAGTCDTGEDLPGPSLEASEEGLDELVARHAALSVDQLDEELPLIEGQVLHLRFHIFLEFLLDSLEVGLLLLLGQGLHVFVGLDDRGRYILGVGIDLLDVTYAPPELSSLLDSEGTDSAIGGDIYLGKLDHQKAVIDGPTRRVCARSLRMKLHTHSAESEEK